MSQKERHRLQVAEMAFNAESGRSAVGADAALGAEAAEAGAGPLLLRPVQRQGGGKRRREERSRSPTTEIYSDATSLHP